MAEHLIPIHSSLDLATATRITDEALRLRLMHGLLPLAVAVLDAGGQTVSFRREDGCGVLRHDIAHGKAWGALGMGMATRQIRDRLADRPSFQAALAVASGGRFIATPGGVLIVNSVKNSLWIFIPWKAPFSRPSPTGFSPAPWHW